MTPLIEAVRDRDEGAETEYDERDEIHVAVDPIQPVGVLDLAHLQNTHE